MKKKRAQKNAKKTGGAFWKLPRYRALTVVGVVGLGVIASAALFVVVRGWERTRLQASFDQMAADRVYVVLNGINNNVGALQSIRAFYAVNEGIQEPGFRTFVREDLSHHAEIQALAWVPRVLDRERELYEETVRLQGRSTFHIVELDAQGRLRKATQHEDFFPIQTVEPLETRVALAGLDLTSHPALRPALERARDTGEPVTTARVRLGDAPKAPFGCWMVVPLYRKGAPLETLTDRRQNLVAFFAVLVDLGQVVEQALKTLAPGDIDVLLADDTAPAAERALHLYRSHPHADGVVFPSEEPATDSSTGARTELVWRTAFFMMGRQWSIICRAAPQFTVTNRQWESFIILFSGFLST
ncbi:MAG: CHASE domain-containing protein, partial [Candidatus Omnitrophica bacterium]|nr:CHASE domain-containing protein [Candidatus Omnitrophota bacterium]